MIMSTRPVRHSMPALLIGAVVSLGGVVERASAQSRQVPAPDQSHPVVIHSAMIHTVSGRTIESGYIAFESGRIVDVGAGDPPQLANAEIIDAHGLHVYPGLIAAGTTLGLVETSSVSVTVDHAELGSITPEVRAAVAVNPDSDLIPVTRSNGILTALVVPSGGLIAGRCSLMRLDGWTWEHMAIDPEAGLVINWPRTEVSSRSSSGDSAQRRQIAERLEEIDRVFDEAEAYLAARHADSNMTVDLRFEAMRASINREAPVFTRARSSGQIDSAIAWAVRRGLDLVIVGGHEADRSIPLLKRHNVPVIVTGLHRLPGHRDAAYDAPFTLPAKLREAGVTFAIASGTSPAHERNLNHNAATAVAYGLDKDAALRSVTIDAAEIIGLGETHGSLNVGKSATLIITSGDPLQITTDTLVAFIDGRRIDMGDRHKALYAKYREKYQQLGLLGQE